MSADKKDWLRKQLEKNAQENENAKKLLKGENLQNPEQPNDEDLITPNEDANYLNAKHKSIGIGTDSDEKLTKLSYENEDLKLVIDQVAHKQEKRFRLQDHLFTMRILPKENKMPLLSDILTFLHSAFLFIILKIKKFYKPEDRNIAFMTLHQSSLTNSLNTSNLIFRLEI